MPPLCIKNCAVVTGGSIIDDAAIEIRDGKIESVARAPARGVPPDALNGAGLFVAPGFIDTHIHGDPRRIFENEISSGTTAFLATHSCASSAALNRYMDAAATFYAAHPFGHSLIGVRLEGPFINTARAGAQPARFIARPSVARAAELCGIFGPFLKMITVAPELSGIGPVISFFRKRGVRLSIGHSDATYDEAMSGIDRGIGHATHLFNAMRQIDRRDPGVAGACLAEDGVTVEIVADLVHLHPAIVKLLLRAKGQDRIIAVTDSIRAAEGRPPAGKPPAYIGKDGRPAGSGISTIGALRNLVARCGIPLPAAVRMLTENPARFFGLRGKGALRRGADADAVVFDRSFCVKMTIIGGEIAYRGKGI